jgi:DNA repair protein RadA/Sms
MAKKTSAFGCKDCGATFLKWSGRCSACGAMNAIAELNQHEAAMIAGAPAGGGRGARASAGPLAIEGMEAPGATAAARLSTGMAEVDRVLGGGLPAGGVVLIGGEPGIGKSTLLGQVAGAVGANAEVLYVTAEESADQVRARLRRVGGAAARVHLAASGDAAAVAEALLSKRYALVLVDSIQLLSLDGIDGEPGAVSQVRGCAAHLVDAAKRSGTALVIVGHVTKDGGLAGPRLLEHLVDAVLSFEGDRYQDLRVLRATKNRYGSTNEIGLLRMGSAGLEEVADPSGIYLADRDPGVAGSCVVPTIEGNRCLLVEIQALVNPTDYPQPQRRVSGLDQNRVSMVLAVLSRRLRLPLGTCDVFVNATGGAKVLEPAADLAVALAVVSAWREVAVPADLVAVGEVGLGGELRPAPRYDLRASEARRLGFKRLIGPGAGAGRGRVVLNRLGDAIEQALGAP